MRRIVAGLWLGLGMATQSRPADWPHFLGPQYDASTPEPLTAETWPVGELPLRWKKEKGNSYTCPAIVGETLILFHRVGDEEVIEACDAETGETRWRHSYPVTYSDRYGFNNGPRSSPVVAEGRVFTYGVTAILTCLDLKTGDKLWSRHGRQEDGVAPGFFGTGTTPLIMGSRLIVDLGGREGRDVAAFDTATGSVLWTAKTGWGASYAAPIPWPNSAGDKVLVFQGGEGQAEQDSTGGLVCLELATGRVLDQLPWRARRYTSVNASSPVICGPEHVFITQGYFDRECEHNGGALIKISPEGKMKVVWKAEKFGCHWMTPIFYEGHLYGFAGEKENQCDLVCYEVTTGTLKWKHRETWEHQLDKGRTIPLGFKRGSLLRSGGVALILGEWGTLALLKLTPEKPEITHRTQPFIAPSSWVLPAISGQRLYVMQNENDPTNESPMSLRCYDLRKKQMIGK